MANVTEILTEIRERHGMLTPEIVREEARPEQSPIHAFVFNAPMNEAAEAYYLERAHRLIQVARVQVTSNPSETPRFARAFLAIPSETARYQYEPVADVMQDAQLREQARKEIMRHLRSAETSLETFDLLAAGTPSVRATVKAKRAVQTARRELENVA